MVVVKVEEQSGAKNVALIPSVRTFADFKLGVNLYRGSALLKCYGVFSSKIFGTRLKKDDQFLFRKRGGYMLK
ncbi:hypothetical protein BHE74_00045925 [Ensete ventricosum]|nr:hypothetical protein BHE74_00045925 [Ensete ventricosum]